MSKIRVELTDSSELHCFRMVFEVGAQPIEIMLHASTLVDLIHDSSVALCEWQARTSSLLIQRLTGLSEQECRERGLIA